MPAIDLTSVNSQLQQLLQGQAAAVVQLAAVEKAILQEQTASTAAVGKEFLAITATLTGMVNQLGTLATTVALLETQMKVVLANTDPARGISGVMPTQTTAKTSP